MQATIHATEETDRSGGLAARLRAVVLWAALSCQVAGAQDVDASRATWRAAGVTTYDYSYQRVCECHPDIPADTIIAVREGQIVGVRYAREDYIADVELPAERWPWFRTIDDLFALVESAQAQSALVRVTFDERYGYPSRIYIDYVADLVGDEVDMKVTSFTPR